MSATPKRVDSYDYDAPKPNVGSRWIWEPDSPHAREVITVIDRYWNGEEWWVLTTIDGGRSYWNDLSRFWEAVVPA